MKTQTNYNPWAEVDKMIENANKQKKSTKKWYEYQSYSELMLDKNNKWAFPSFMQFIFQNELDKIEMWVGRYDGKRTWTREMLFSALFERKKKKYLDWKQKNKN